MSRSELDAVLESSHQTIRLGSRTFALASALFDHATRDAAHLLYAWCRYCDDRVDGEELGMHPTRGSRAARQRALVEMRRQTEDALGGRLVHDPVFVGLQRVASRYRIPAEYCFELLDGFQMDVDGRVYDSIDELVEYCYHVAGTVGLMMARVMGVGSPRGLRCAAQLGIALQLTNISRDVLDDAEAGRVYLPGAWLARAGLTRETVAEPESRRALVGVVENVLDVAERFYRSGERGLDELAFRSAWAVAVARGIYREIGGVVRRRGAHAWDERAVVSRPRKLWWVARGMVEALMRRRAFATSPLDRELGPAPAGSLHARGVEEAERYGAVFRARVVVDDVGANDVSQVPSARMPGQANPPMHDDIMKDPVDEPVRRHPQSQRNPRPPRAGRAEAVRPRKDQ